MRPRAGLIDVKGTLYGTTQNGGWCDTEGSVFSVTPTGVVTALHSFCNGANGKYDGMWPVASLLAVNGVLYGTTEYGGGHATICRNGGSLITGCGTVFGITRNGQFKLHRFR